MWWVPDCNPSTQEEKQQVKLQASLVNTEGSRPAGSTQRVLGQPGLHSKSLSQNKTYKQQQ